MYRDHPNAEQAPSPQQQQRQEPAPNYHVHHDFDGSAELTATLAHAISNVTGADVTDTGFTLNDYVDPEALDRLFKPKSDGMPRGHGHVSFVVWGYQVTVYSSGRIVIAPQAQPQQMQGQGQGQGQPL